jgi:peroxiredoxin
VSPGLRTRSRRRWRSLALLLALAWPGCSAQEPGDAPGAGSAAAAETAGDPAPDFTLPDLEGATIRLSDYRGKTVIVDFWATWCPPCVFQVPELNKLRAAHRAQDDLEVIGVAVDVEGAEVVAPWVAEQGVEYTIVLGDEELAQAFGALGFPTLVVVTPDGRLDSMHVGLVEYETLESLVAKLTPDRPI